MRFARQGVVHLGDLLMRKSLLSQLSVIFGVFLSACALVLLPGCSGTSGDHTETVETVPHVQETETGKQDDTFEHDNYDEGTNDYEYDGISSSLGETTTTLDDGTVMTYDDDGIIYYENPDGSLEVTNGWGNVVKDIDGDGLADSYSIDGGESWGYL